MRGKTKIVILSALVTLVVWGVFSWPLPRYAFRGIPSSAHSAEKFDARKMLAGDHLQLHYFYWLFSDMLSGGTPFWHNLYEFNTGDDAERRHVANYNMPLSFVYAAGRAIGGRAFGWNVTGFMTLWGTLLATWLLVERYTQEYRWSLLCAILSVTIPYRWIALLGGSPTGLAMVWVPVMFLGLDMAGRDDSLKGGLLAGLALAFSYWNDPHTFYFAVFSIPVVYLAGFVRRSRYPWHAGECWTSLMRGVLPVAAVVLGLTVVGQAVKTATFTGTTMEAGRHVHEVLLFTPRVQGLFGHRANQTDLQIFIGYVLPALFAVHLLLWLAGMRKASGTRLRHGMLMLLLYGAIFSMIMVALGPRGPLANVFFELPRRFLPGYPMIRQTGKIFALMPPTLAVAAGVAAFEITKHVRRRRLRIAVVAVPLLIVFAESRATLRPSVCILDFSQPAYEAVSLDAAQDTEVAHAHALAIPLWPGDSHWSSLYQHYASLYRIRMLNGYSPIVHEAYREIAVDQFGSVNAGFLDDAQLDALMEMGIHYVVFHEDAFPERVSAYPVILTLRRLLNHERLELLAQGGSIRSFRILARPRAVTEVLPDGPFFPSLRWNAADLRLERARIHDDESAWRGEYTRLETGAEARMRHTFNHMYAPEPHVWIRVRGHGVGRFTRYPEDSRPVSRAVDSETWEWIAIPLPTHRERMQFGIEVTEGLLDIDMMTQIAGTGGWQPPAAGESVSFPAALFFRAGYTDIREKSVTLRPEYDAASVVFYGPRLPFPAGSYTITIRYHSDAPFGIRLGTFTLSNGQTVSRPVAVEAGREAVTEFYHPWNLPLTLKFVYTRNGPITIQGVDVKRHSNQE